APMTTTLAVVGNSWSLMEALASGRQRVAKGA
ncbi:MAG: hypothetical protein ACI9N0_003291, partial [Ilumatobacter sp.]